MTQVLDLHTISLRPQPVPPPVYTWIDDSETEAIVYQEMAHRSRYAYDVQVQRRHGRTQLLGAIEYNEQQQVWQVTHIERQTVVPTEFAFMTHSEAATYLHTQMLERKRRQRLADRAFA
ncbi:hypothetical protein H6F43_04195 [Leptolyngbya sp. FACHB-36]|uniref:hypothetical protein n=1 Tax=Leptolyngbya sp. FACHB-36 TaxID=2692808 RepID=UPI00168121B5|nr:hypothetical protein [Leptolyngbya sp. FACHB-36]MBD2019384.1 hypothetical protein [Leptolyngbya sp. FACHB-36]